MANPIATLFIDLKAGIGNFEKDLDRSIKVLNNTGKQWQKSGQAMMKAFTLPLVGIGAGLLKTGDDFGKAYGVIQARTGETGKALDQLKKDFKSTFEKVPDDMQQVALAIAQINARTGQTGTGLQALAENFLKLSRVTGTDLSENIRQITRLFGDWSIAQEDQAGVMDQLMRASQATGASVTQIAERAVFAGTSLRAFGFDLQTTIAVMAQMEQQGVNAEIVFASMRIALGKLAASGVPNAAAAFRQLLIDIKNLDTTKAVAKSIEFFGRKAGPDMALAIKEGRFEIDKLLQTIVKGDGTIKNSTSEAVRFASSWTTVQHALQVALEPISTTLVRVVASAVPLIKAMAQGIGFLVNSLMLLPSPVQQSLVGLLLLGAAIGPAKFAWGIFTTGAAAAASTLKVLGGVILSAVAAAFTVVGTAMTTVISGFQALAATTLPALLTAMAPLAIFLGTIAGAFTIAYQCSENFRRGLDELAATIKAVPQNAANIWDFVRLKIAQVTGDQEKANQVIQEFKDRTSGAGKEGETAGEMLSKAFGGVKDAISSLIPTAEDFNFDLDQFSKNSKKAADELKKTKERFEEFKRTTEAGISYDKVSGALTSAMERTSQADFASALGNYKSALMAKTMEGLRQSFKGIKDADLQPIADKIVGAELEQKTTEWAKHMAEEAKKAHEEHVQFFAGLMEDAISGSRFSFEDQFKKAIVAIASRWLAYMVDSNLGIVGSLKEAFASWWADSGIGSVTKAGTNAATTAATNAATTAGTNAATTGATGAGTGAAATGAGASHLGTMGVIGGIAAAFFGIWRSMQNVDEMKKELGRPLTQDEIRNAWAPEVELGLTNNAWPIWTGDWPDWLKIADPLIGYVGPAITDTISNFFVSNFSGSNDPENLARRWARSQIADTTELDEELTYTSPTGGTMQMTRLPYNIDFANNKQASSGISMTGGLGTVFSGGDEKLAQDMTGMFTNAVTQGAESFNDVLVNTLALMDQMKVTAQQGKDTLMEMFLDGKIGMDELGSGIQSFNILAQDNLTGTGSVNDALNIIAENMGPDGSPRQALKGLELAFKEAAELGGDQMATLLDFITRRFGPEAAKVFQQNIAEAGVDSFEDFQNLSADQMFQLFEAIQQWSGDTQEEFDDVQDEFDETIEAAEELATAIEDIPEEKDININVHENTGVAGPDAEGWDDIKNHFGRGGIIGMARGGILTGPRMFTGMNGKRFQVGELGPEAILPLTMTSKGLGVQATGLGGGVNVVYQIDARGAAPGTENKIYRAIRLAEERAVQRSARIMARR